MYGARPPAASRPFIAQQRHAGAITSSSTGSITESSAPTRARRAQKAKCTITKSRQGNEHHHRAREVRSTPPCLRAVTGKTDISARTHVFRELQVRWVNEQKRLRQRSFHAEHRRPHNARAWHAYATHARARCSVTRDEIEKIWRSLTGCATKRMSVDMKILQAFKAISSDKAGLPDGGVVAFQVAFACLRRILSYLHISFFLRFYPTAG